MKIISYRTTMPFDNRTNGDPSISPPTSKSIMPFNNVTTIQDVLNGNRTISDTYPHAGGDWSSGEDVDKSYKEKGDDYKREVRDFDIVRKLLDKKERNCEKWRVKTPKGISEFISFGLARQYISDNNLPFSYLTRVAQNKLNESKNSHSVIVDAMPKCFMVESINAAQSVKENGSSFCVEKNKFITCAHVISSYNKNKDLENKDFGNNIIISLVQDGSRYPAKLLKFDLKKDLALLESEINVKPFVLDDSISIGDEIITIGSPHGYENNVSIGTVGSFERKIYFYDGAPEYMFVDLAVFPGNSGGPVINRNNGKVIGMITLVISKGGEYGLNAALPSLYVKKFLENF